MAYKFTVTLPDEVGQDLQKWAKGEGRPTANLAAFLIELGVKRKFPDKYPEIEPGKGK
ncbi:hypothetical protein H6F80_12695 [Leptolyngbya sp. FACHB-711]|nr:hypothetical protein [Leptolyngbya sp. FACHB-711]